MDTGTITRFIFRYTAKKVAFLHGLIDHVTLVGGLMSMRREPRKNKLNRSKQWKKTLFPWLVK